MTMKRNILIIVTSLYFLMLGVLTIFSGEFQKSSLPVLQRTRITSSELNGTYYDQVLPSSAVFADENGNYVFQLIERETPLGKRFYIERINAHIIFVDPENNMIALETSLNDESYVVIADSEELADKQIVRIRN